MNTAANKLAKADPVLADIINNRLDERYKELHDLMWTKLAECDAVFRSGSTVESLTVCCDVWMTTLQNLLVRPYAAQVLQRSFQHWITEEDHFPVPRDIIRIMHNIFDALRREAARALPPPEAIPVAVFEHNVKTCELIRKSIRGDSSATLALMEHLNPDRNPNQ